MTQISPHLLRVDASYSYRTYGGYLEGAPSSAVMIESARQKAAEMWGSRAILVLDPVIKNGKYLSTYTHMIWATGPEADKENDGSELVILWWSELPPDTDRVLQAVDWSSYAKDFQY